MRAMDQGGQGRDQVDAVVMPNIRRQRRPFSASCARLQSRQFPANPGDAGADQGLVTDEPEGEADQDRREGREPRPLRRLPDGRGCHPTANVPGDFAAHRGTTAAATPSASMRRSIVMKWLAVATGIAALVLTLLTNHELGVIKVVPFWFHLDVDRLVGAAFVAAPVVLRFSGLDAIYYWINGAAV